MEIVSGADLVFSVTKLEEKIKTASIVFTGEGKIDESTFQGKVVAKVFIPILFVYFALIVVTVA